MSDGDRLANPGLLRRSCGISLLLAAILSTSACRSHKIFLEISERQPEQARPRVGVLRSRVVKLDASVLEHLERREGAQFEINTFDKTPLAVSTDNYQTLPDGGELWRGHISGKEGRFSLLKRGSAASLVVRGPGLNYGTVPLDGDHLSLYQFDPEMYSGCGVTDEHRIRFSPRRGLRELRLPEPVEDGSKITVLVLYTPATRRALGDANQVGLLIDHSVDETNTAYQNSQIRQRLVAVGKSELDYAESGDLGRDLDALSSNATVASLRNSAKADLVTILIDHSDNPQLAGLGNVMATVDSRFEAKAFSVILWQGARDNLSFAHELAHNMGADHDRDNRCAGAYVYSCGWRFMANGNPYRDIMAYPPGQRLPYFSNPQVLFQGVATGSIDTSSTPADNARTLNSTAKTVANFRN